MYSINKYLKRIFTLAPEHKYYLPVSFLCFTWFFIIAYLVHNKQTIEMDNLMYLNFSILNDWFGEDIWRYITFLGDVIFVVPLVLFISYFLWIKQHLTRLSFFIFSVLGGGLLGYAFKAIIASSRPDNMLIWLDGHYSFPSGHTIVAFTLYLAVLMIWHKHILRMNLLKRNLLIILSSLIIFLIPLSRLALGVHWFTDVVGGIFLGLGWVLLVFSFYRESWS